MINKKAVFISGKRASCTGCGNWLEYKDYCEFCQGDKK